MTTDRPVTLQEYAMKFGTYMGIYWILKFMLLPSGFNIPLLQLFFVVLTLFVPVLGYFYARRFRDKYCNGEISFLRALAFSVYVYLFATLLVAVAHYIYFRFMDHGFMAGAYREQVENLIAQVGESQGGGFELLLQSIDLISSLTPLQLTFQLISQNVFYGIVFSIPTALLVMKHRKPSL